MTARRIHIIFILVTAFLTLVTAIGRAQPDPPIRPHKDPIIVHEPLQAMIDGVVEEFEATDSLDRIAVPMILMADEPSDSCEDAPSLIMFPSNPADGGVANVSDATVAADDPILACQWGNPTRAQGYRTVWYKFVAPVNGRVTIDTFNSNYDTVLGVFTGTCGALDSIRCNDDFNLFSSQVTFAVNGGETYYVEVADRESGLPRPAHLQLSALLLPVDTLWAQEITNPAPPPLSRHAVVTQNEFLYVVGGQSGDREPGLPQISNRLVRFNTNTLHWEEMAPIPGPGYSNTTAARVGDFIYLPTGYNGNQLQYDGIHWRYSIVHDAWEPIGNTPTAPHGVPYAWAAAAVPPDQATFPRYYLTGGLSSTLDNVPPVDVEDRVVNDTFAYDVASNSWVEQKPMQAGRYAHTAAWIETRGLGLCVAGGLGVQADPNGGQPVTVLQSSAECYQPGGDWHYIGDLNVPRFGAGSAIGPDGKWYVFGGMTAIGSILIPTPVTEVYDPVRNTWSVLDPSYNLGNFQTLPARFWPRGATIGNNLWVVGGSIFNEGEHAVPVVERLNLPTYTNYVPVLGANYDDATRPDDTFAEARTISFGINETRNFDQQRDFFDVYTFEILSPYSIQVRLIVPDDNNFDVAVYGRQKTQWGHSFDPRNGHDEEITLNNLPPNRYYVVVSRVFPTGQPDKGAYYTLGVE